MQIIVLATAFYLIPHCHISLPSKNKHNVLHATVLDECILGAYNRFLRYPDPFCSGIDSTAKLWRATLPVDDKLDDSDSVSTICQNL